MALPILIFPFFRFLLRLPISHLSVIVFIPFFYPKSQPKINSRLFEPNSNVQKQKMLAHWPSVRTKKPTLFKKLYAIWRSTPLTTAPRGQPAKHETTGIPVELSQYVAVDL